ncbi:MAG: DUF2079 domain-containing protein [Nanobdellota archaeon]
MRLLFVLIILFLFPLFLHDHIHDEDWYEIASYYASARTAAEEGTMHFWSPYFGGGFFMLGHPEDISLSPLFLFVLAFGEMWGLKLILLLLFIVGGWAMYRLCRHELGYSGHGSFFAAAVFLFSGYFAYQVADGNLHSEPLFLLLPLGVLLWRKSMRRPRYLGFLVLLYGVILMTGALVWVTMVCFLVLYALVQGRLRKTGKMLALFLVGVALVGAVKLVPVIDLLEDSDGCIDGFSGSCAGSYGRTLSNTLSFTEVLKGLFWPGTMLYVGVVPLFFLLRGMTRRDGILLLFLILSITGTYLPFFRFIWEVPSFDYVFSVTKYCAPLIVFMLALVAGRGVRGHRVVILPLVALGVISLFFSSSQLYGIYAPDRDLQESGFYQVRIDNVTSRDSLSLAEQQYHLVKQGIGIINWYSAITVDEVAEPRYIGGHENPDYRGEVYPAAYVNNYEIGVSKIRLDLSAEVPVTVNQNYHPYWKADCGQLSAVDGLLGVNPDCETVQLRFVPPYFYLTLIVSMVGFVGSIGYAFRFF